jgi:hypothetical protein
MLLNVLYLIAPSYLHQILVTPDANTQTVVKLSRQWGKLHVN